MLDQKEAEAPPERAGSERLRGEGGGVPGAGAAAGSGARRSSEGDRRQSGWTTSTIWISSGRASACRRTGSVTRRLSTRCWATRCSDDMTKSIERRDTLRTLFHITRGAEGGEGAGGQGDRNEQGRFRPSGRRRSGRRRRSTPTIPAPAEAERSTSSAAGAKQSA